MEFIWIEDFLALYYTRNFTKAAEIRSTTQPAFSRRIQKLEHWAGVPLFNRVVRPIELTSSGQSFLSSAERVRAEVLDARRIVKINTSTLQNPTRIYTVNTLSINFFPDFAKERNLQNFSLAVVSTTGALEGLRKKRANYALIPQFSDDLDLSHLSVQQVHKGKLILVEKKDTKHAMTLENNKLTGPVLSYKPGTAIGRRINSHLQDLNISYLSAPICECESPESLTALIESGFGATWIPEMKMNDKLQLCKVPKTLDIDYQILWLSNH